MKKIFLSSYRSSSKDEHDNDEQVYSISVMMKSPSSYQTITGFNL